MAQKHTKLATPLKTKIAPEHQWLEDVFPTEIVPFLGDDFVSFLVVLGGFVSL